MDAAPTEAAPTGLASTPKAKPTWPWVVLGVVLMPLCYTVGGAVFGVLGTMVNLDLLGVVGALLVHTAAIVALGRALKLRTRSIVALAVGIPIAFTVELFGWFGALMAMG